MVVLFFISSTITLFGGGLFVYAGNWAFLSKTLRKTHFHSCRDAGRSFSNPEPYSFTDIGRTTIVAITEFHSWKGPQQSSRTVPFLHRWEDRFQKHELTCSWCSSSLVTKHIVNIALVLSSSSYYSTLCNTQGYHVYPQFFLTYYNYQLIWGYHRLIWQTSKMLSLTWILIVFMLDDWFSITSHCSSWHCLAKQAVFSGFASRSLLTSSHR